MRKLKVLQTFGVLLEVVENNVNFGFRYNFSVVGKEFDKVCSEEERVFLSIIAFKKSGGDGGFICCVFGCFSNNKNFEFFFYNFFYRKSLELQELRKRWIYLICRENFILTLGYRVCLYFLGVRKIYMNCLLIIVFKIIKFMLIILRLMKKVRNRICLFRVEY